MTTSTTARHALTGIPGTVPATARCCFTLSHELVSDRYEQWWEESRTVTTDLGRAIVTGSRTYTGEHAPAFDLDFPAVLTVDGHGQVTLWVDAPLRRAALWLLLRRTARLGITVPTAWASLDLQARFDAYQVESRRALDTTGRDETLRRSTGGFGAATVEEALATAEAIATKDGQPYRLTQAPRMTNPWPIRLRVPATLLPSSRNHHLLVEAPMPWTEYRRVLAAAGRARLLEKNYAAVSINRQNSCLRLPWVTKTQWERTQPR